MDYYDKSQSKLNDSSATPAPTAAHGTGLEEYPGCDSDIYLAYEQAPTREIINAIEGMGLTRDATNLSQLLEAIQKAQQSVVELTDVNTTGSGTSQDLDLSFADDLVDLSKIQGNIGLVVPRTPDSHPVNIRYTFAFFGGVWNWTIFAVGSAGSSGVGGITSDSGTGLVATLPQLTVITQLIDVVVTISDANIRSALTLGSSSNFSHGITAELYGA